MKLDLSALEKAAQRLDESLEYMNSETAARDSKLRVVFRAAAIQAFEFTFELCAKMILRQLSQVEVNPAELKKMTFIDLMRTAATRGLVRDPEMFMKFRELRNMTSHTYDESRAAEVALALPSFLAETRAVLAELKARNA